MDCCDFEQLKKTVLKRISKTIEVGGGTMGNSKTGIATNTPENFTQSRSTTENTM